MIIEILGALNTVGRYLVNMTRGQDINPSSNSGTSPSDSIPDAILTLSKNVLGQNVTETIAPLIKRVGTVDDGISDNGFISETKKKKRDQIIKLEHLQLHQSVNDVTTTQSTETTTTVSTSTSKPIEPGKNNLNQSTLKKKYYM